MDHGLYGPAEINAGDPTLHFQPWPVSDVPFYMHQVLNPNAPPPPPPPHTFREGTTFTPPPPPPASAAKYSSPATWHELSGGRGSGINLNHGTNSYAQCTTVRWPRQETLTLLEIRARLDPCFKEATSSNHKSLLWDEISRIMNEEYGHTRSGRKCKEKFENLYKYYKKTKEGKVGKHDGKHYRFFRQLDALFGDHINNNNIVYQINRSNNSSKYDIRSCEKNRRCDSELENKELIATIEESIESHLEKLMVKQDEWGKNILRMIERKEGERIFKEEEWRKCEVARLDNEYENWASHVARIETRDKSILDALDDLIRVRSMGFGHRNVERTANWIEHEVSNLIKIRTNMECKFQENDQKQRERLWEEVAFELSEIGYNRSESECKETWEKICAHFSKTMIECENLSRDVSNSLRIINSMEDAV